ncbi:MAG: hypothetical protein J6Q18_00510, partial [Oscillospiraceae bacterium]|nr:hypothetical protein [Oscillospiraceae bacterium]
MSIKRFKDTFQRMYRNSVYRIWLWVLGFFTVLVTFIKYKSLKGKDQFAAIKADLRKELEATDLQEQLLHDAMLQARKKNEYFKKNASEADIEKEAKAIAGKNFEQILHDRAQIAAEMQGVREVTMAQVYGDLIDNKLFLIDSVVLSFPMYIVMVLFQNPISKYATDRIVMMIFVL